MMNVDISTDSHTINVAFTSKAAIVTVSNCIGGNPATEVFVPEVKKVDVKMLTSKIIMFAMPRPIKCGLNENFFNSR